MAKKTAKKKSMKKGAKYTCEVCGMTVIVDEICGCEACDLSCCDEPMKPE
jgi:rubrerythrin